MVEEIIGRLPELSGAQLGHLEDEILRERQRRASSAGGGRNASRDQESAAPPVTEVLEYRPYEDGHLQLELRRYVRRDGSARERGHYCYFQFHEGGKRKKLYLGKTSDPESTLAAKRRYARKLWMGDFLRHAVYLPKKVVKRSGANAGGKDTPQCTDYIRTRPSVMNSCSTSTRSLEPEREGCSPKRLRPKCRNRERAH